MVQLIYSIYLFLRILFGKVDEALMGSLSLCQGILMTY